MEMEQRDWFARARGQGRILASRGEFRECGAVCWAFIQQRRRWLMRDTSFVTTSQPSKFPFTWSGGCVQNSAANASSAFFYAPTVSSLLRWLLVSHTSNVAHKCCPPKIKGPARTRWRNHGRPIPSKHRHHLRFSHDGRRSGRRAGNHVATPHTNNNNHRLCSCTRISVRMGARDSLLHVRADERGPCRAGFADGTGPCGECAAGGGGWRGGSAQVVTSHARSGERRAGVNAAPRQLPADPHRLRSVSQTHTALPSTASRRANDAASFNRFNVPARPLRRAAWDGATLPPGPAFDARPRRRAQRRRRMHSANHPQQCGRRVQAALTPPHHHAPPATNAN
ncbi:unnamed protein product [Lampetra fluviatilis]